MFSDLFLVERSLGAVEGATYGVGGGGEGRWHLPGRGISKKELDEIRDKMRSLLRVGVEAGAEVGGGGGGWDAEEAPSLRAAGEPDELGALLGESRLSARRSVRNVLGALCGLFALRAAVDVEHTAAGGGGVAKVAVLGGGAVGEILLRGCLAVFGDLSHSVKVCVATAHPLRSEYDEFRDAGFVLVRDARVVLEDATAVILAHPTSVFPELIPSFRGCIPANTPIFSLLGPAIAVETIEKATERRNPVVAVDTSPPADALDALIDEISTALRHTPIPHHADHPTHLEPALWKAFPAVAHLLSAPTANLLRPALPSLLHALTQLGRKNGLSHAVAAALALSATLGASKKRKGARETGGEGEE